VSVQAAATMANRSRKRDRLRGVVVEWFDERGFGFIQPDAEGPKVFFHASSLRDHYVRAQVGDKVTFTEGPGKDGKTAAFDIAVAGVPPPKRKTGLDVAQEQFRVYAAGLLIGLTLLDIILDRAPAAMAFFYLLAGMISAVLYSSDKSQASRGEERVPEVVLHAIDLAGGIVGGLIAQHFMRHKITKSGFAATTGLIVGIHLLLLLALLAGLIPLAGLAALAD
jgi:uncharacterized membrane protein YsdA (DUF1294 family)/cold shock CspA family protein